MGLSSGAYSKSSTKYTNNTVLYNEHFHAAWEKNKTNNNKYDQNTQTHALGHECFPTAIPPLEGQGLVPHLSLQPGWRESPGSRTTLTESPEQLGPFPESNLTHPRFRSWQPVVMMDSAVWVSVSKTLVMPTLNGALSSVMSGQTSPARASSLLQRQRWD